MADLEDGLPIPAADERMVLSLQSVSMTILSCLSLYMQQHNQVSTLVTTGLPFGSPIIARSSKGLSSM